MVDLLKGHHVRLELPQDRGNPVQIDSVVHPATMLYVVSHQSECGSFRCHERTAACPKDALNKKDRSQKTECKVRTHKRALDELRVFVTGKRFSCFSRRSQEQGVTL